MRGVAKYADFVRPPRSQSILGGFFAPLTRHAVCMPCLQVTPGHQTRLLAFTEEALAAGRRGELAGKTFTQPSAQWAQLNKSREMLQYGVYTNSYADLLHSAPRLCPFSLPHLLV